MTISELKEQASKYPNTLWKMSNLAVGLEPWYYICTGSEVIRVMGMGEGVVNFVIKAENDHTPIIQITLPKEFKRMQTI